jgi:hypothetical protein
MKRVVGANNGRRKRREKKTTWRARPAPSTLAPAFRQLRTDPSPRPPPSCPRFEFDRFLTPCPLFFVCEMKHDMRGKRGVDRFPPLTFPPLLRGLPPSHGSLSVQATTERGGSRGTGLSVFRLLPRTRRRSPLSLYPLSFLLQYEKSGAPPTHPRLSPTVHKTPPKREAAGQARGGRRGRG